MDIIPDENMITKIINDWLNSLERKEMLQAKDYYSGNADIKNRQFYYWGIRKEKQSPDENRSNLKINNDFLGILIDQKIDYCLAKDVITSVDLYTFDINDFIDKAGEEASKCGISWLFYYINDEGELKNKVVESENIIALRDGSIEDNLVGVIRIYKIGDDDYAEYYNKDIKRLFKKSNIQDEKGDYISPNYKLVEETTHFVGGSFGAIPFIPFYNNNNMQNDLCKIKALIDAYDIIESDFANNFVDFQELILFITNYSENASTEEAARELMEWLKKYKLISVRKDGKMEILSKEVPYEARSEFLSILRKNIFYFGRGVDIDQLKGGSLTNVVIKAYFAGLDMKANKFIKQSKKFIKRNYEFLNNFNEFKNAKETIVNVKNVEITFNKSTIVSESEIIEGIVKSDGIISRETNVKNHPFVDNLEEELKRIDEDEQRNLENMNNEKLDLEDDNSE